MAKPQTPELKVYMDKRLNVKLNAERSVTGRLRGFDHFMNLVLDEAVEETKGAERIEIGLIVRPPRPAVALALCCGRVRLRARRLADAATAALLCALPLRPRACRSSVATVLCRLNAWTE